MLHVVLFGDSTLDIGPYTGGGPAVIDLLRTQLGDHGRASLLAMDGAMAEDVAHQTRHAPDDATHAILSVEGNDAMMQVDVLMRPSGRVWDALTTLSQVADELEIVYRRCVSDVLRLGLDTTLCTIYNGAFDERSGEQRVVATALRIFNDSILQVALDNDLSVIDLRRVCTLRSDYANPIEPNAEGGRKIAAAVLAATLDTAAAPSVVPSRRHML